MKSYLTIFAFLFINTCFAQQKYWKATISMGEFGLINTNFYIDQTNTYFSGTTKTDANKRMLGGLKGSFAKGMFQKNGSIMEIDSFLVENDLVTGFLLVQKKKYYLQGKKEGNKVTANITGKTSGKIYGKIILNEVAVIEKPNNYVQVWNEIKSKTESNIYHQSVLESKEWKNLVAYMNDFSEKAQDDAEFVYGFYYKSAELPFSHYSLTGNKEQTKDYEIAGVTKSENNGKPTLKTINANTLLINIPEFNFRVEDIDGIMNEVVNSDAKNLIFDLRENPGGDLEGAMRITQYLSDKTIYGGVVLSQYYWKNNTSLPLPKDYNKFKVMSNANYEWYKKEVKSGIEGLSIIAEPLSKTFKGKVYILTSNITASTSEPFVYTLQKENIATVIGAKTAGAVLSMEYFFIDNFALTIPMLDYYSFDGKRLDKVGVIPNILCDPKDALNVALKEISKN